MNFEYETHSLEQSILGGRAIRTHVTRSFGKAVGAQQRGPVFQVTWPRLGQPLAWVSDRLRIPEPSRLPPRVLGQGASELGFFMPTR